MNVYYKQKITNNPNYTETSFHQHSTYEILLFESGNAELVLEDRKTLLSPCSLLFVPPCVKHRVNLLSDLPYKRTVIGFDTLPDGIVFGDEPVIFDVSDNKHILSVFERFFEYNNFLSPDQKNIVFKSMLCELLVLLQSITVSKTAEVYGQFMSKAIEYIDENLTTVGGISQLCDALHISRAGLYREFEASLGISPVRYIKQKRLLIARDLLLLGEDATKVCERSGFRDYSAFYRAYCKYFGNSPTKK